MNSKKPTPNRTLVHDANNRLASIMLLAELVGGEQHAKEQKNFAKQIIGEVKKIRKLLQKVT